MNAKTRNKIATAGIYTLVSIVVIILFGILGDILVSGVPHLSWSRHHSNIKRVWR